MEQALAAFKEWNEKAFLQRRKQIVDWALQRWHVEEPEGAALEALQDEDDLDEE